MRDKWWAKTLRVIGIVLLSLTAVFTLMGGAGTSCVALNPTGYEGKFAGIAPYQWLWFLFVLIGVAAGILQVRAVVQAIKGARDAYRAALIGLLLGVVINAIHVYASRALRGGSMPVDMVLYFNLLTLAVFLLFRIPGIWQGVNFEKPAGGKGTGRKAAGIALLLCGLLALTIQFLMAPTHVIGGVNYADVWHLTFSLLGGGLVLAGLGALFAPGLRLRRAAQAAKA